MAVEAELLPPASQELDPIEAAHKDPESALLNPEKRAAFLAKVREVSKIENPDVSTNKGRDEIRSMAMKVTRVRTMMDAARKGATEDLRRRVKEINDAGNQVIDELLAIGDEVRAPLTAWEEAEKERERRAAELLTWLRSAAIVSIEDTSATVRERGKQAYDIEVTKELFASRYNEAVSVKQTTVDTLMSALRRLTQQEAEQAELEALRQEKLAREEEDRKRLEAEEQAEREAAAAREAEQHKKDEAARLERAQAEAAEAAAQAEREAAQREIDAANERAAQAERDAEAARQKLIKEQEERNRAEQAERDAAAAREKNTKHRREVMGQVKVDLIQAAGITEEQTVAAVRALVGGKVRHVQVNF